MNDIVKICKVHGDLTVDKVYIAKSVRKCRDCLLKTQKEWREKNRGHCAIWRSRNKEKYDLHKIKGALIKKKRREDNPENARLKYKKYRDTNRDKILEREKIYAKHSVDSLSDSYVKQAIVKKTSLKYKDIPQDLIDLKRTHLKIIRLIKQK